MKTSHACFQQENFNMIDFLQEQITLLNNTYLFLFLDNENINKPNYCKNNNETIECLFLMDNKKVKEIIDFSYELNKNVYGNSFNKKGYNTFFDKSINSLINKNTNSTSSSDIESLLVLFNIFIKKLIAFIHIFNTFTKSDKLKSFIEKIVRNVFNINEFSYCENHTKLYNGYFSNYGNVVSKIKDYYVFVPDIKLNEKVYRIYFDKFYFQKDEVVKMFFTYMKRFLEWKGNITYIDVKNSLFKFMLDFDVNKVVNSFTVYHEKSKNDYELYEKVERMLFNVRGLFVKKRRDIKKENIEVENHSVNKVKETNFNHLTLLKTMNNDFVKEFRKQLENRINGLPFSDVDLFSILSKEFQVSKNELKHEFIVFVNKFISKLQKNINSRSAFPFKNSLSLSELERMFEGFISDILLNSNFKHMDIYYNLIKDKLFYYFRLSVKSSNIQGKFYYDYAKYLWNYQKTLLERFGIRNYKLLYINFDGLIFLEQ